MNSVVGFEYGPAKPEELENPMTKRFFRYPAGDAATGPAGGEIGREVKTAGRQDWYFADGYLPEKNGHEGMEAHEALMVFNLAKAPAELELSVYFSDRPPLKGLRLHVGAERVVSFRLDHPSEIDGGVIPVLTQYALHIHASVPVICQFGRLDTTQAAMAYYVGIGYAE